MNFCSNWRRRRLFQLTGCSDLCEKFLSCRFIIKSVWIIGNIESSNAANKSKCAQEFFNKAVAGTKRADFHFFVWQINKYSDCMASTSNAAVQNAALTFQMRFDGSRSERLSITHGKEFSEYENKFVKHLSMFGEKLLNWVSVIRQKNHNFLAENLSGPLPPTKPCSVFDLCDIYTHD